MTKNLGAIDRALRIVVGLVLIAYALKLGFREPAAIGPAGSALFR